VQWEGGRVDCHVSYFMNKTFPVCESEECAHMTVSDWAHSVVLCIPTGIQWFITALHLHISSFGDSRLSLYLSLQQDGDEVGLRAGEAGAEDVL